MVSSMFYYTRKDGEKEFKDSFNINKVIRTLEEEDGKTLVLLDDLHERVMEVPVYDQRTGKVKETRRERNTYQSEIHLEPEDAKRLFTLTNVQ